MKLQQKFENMLVENGMFEGQAKEVMAIVMADEANEAMAERWNDDEEGYPEQLFDVIWFSIKGTALEYIEKNCPMAWFKPMFE
jgi:hypothetical protein